MATDLIDAFERALARSRSAAEAVRRVASAVGLDVPTTARVLSRSATETRHTIPNVVHEIARSDVQRKRPRPHPGR